MIDLVHVINLREREDRWLSVLNQSAQEGFMIRRWDGVTGNLRRCTNISQAFKKVIRWAKENNLQHVTIAEDDIVFTAPGAWQHYIKNFPQEFDLYLGGIYAGQLNGNRIMNGYSGNTLVTVHSKFYDFVLSANENDHLDRWLGNFAHDHLYIVVMPFCCQQNGSYSDNHRKKPNYSAFHEQFKYFTGVNL